MYKDKKILCTILARGGSKRLPGKNTKLLNGKPLISYAIQAAKSSQYIDRVIVSTDDESIARVAKEVGAEVPFMRPAELASDTATVIAAVQHAVTYLREHESYTPDAHVLVQLTTPFVQKGDIDAAIETFFTTGANSCVSVCEITDRPELMGRLSGERLTPFMEGDIPERNQDMPKLFRLNGAVYVTKMEVVMEKGLIYDGSDCAAIIMPRERSVDIDTPLDFVIAETLMKSAETSTL